MSSRSTPAQVEEVNNLDPAYVGPPREEWVGGTLIRTTPVGGAGERMVVVLWQNPVGPLPCPNTSDWHYAHLWQPAAMKPETDRWWMCVPQVRGDAEPSDACVHATLTDTFERLDASLAELPKVVGEVVAPVKAPEYVGRHRAKDTTIDCGVADLAGGVSGLDLQPVTREGVLEELGAALNDAQRHATWLYERTAGEGPTSKWVDTLVQALHVAQDTARGLFRAEEAAS